MGETAKYYGTTYSAIENRFRKIRKDAEALKKEAGEGEGTPTNSKVSTPASRSNKKHDVLHSMWSLFFAFVGNLLTFE